MKKDPGHVPRNVSRKIMERMGESNEPVVVTNRKGKPSRVFGFREYQKMVELPNRVKPWAHRKEKKMTPDPLGAVDASPPASLTRESIYEE